jgi:microcystin-dependent protein
MEQLKTTIAQGTFMMPIGTVMMWHTVTPPVGWLICNGGTELKTQYPLLYALIGNTFGSDSTHFTLPNYTETSPFGADSTYQLNQNYGALTHTLTTSEIPAHNHGVTDPGHHHGPNSPSTVLRAAHSGGSQAYQITTGAQVVTQDVQTADASTGISTQNAGSGGSHSILHPVFAVFFIIYAGFPVS